MKLTAILLLGVGLSLDSLAASLSLGCNASRITRAQQVRFVAVVGAMHLLLCLVGWSVGEQMLHLIEHYAHWVAFGVLSALGLNMCYEAIKHPQESTPKTGLLSLSHTLLLSTALSLDALVAGFSLGLVRVDLGGGNPLENILLAGAVIGATVSLISSAGLLVGARSARLLGHYSGVVGGVILIGIAAGILAQAL